MSGAAFAAPEHYDGGSSMKKPQMIFFDYGHTLVYEPEQDYLRGARAVLSHAVKNPEGITPERLNEEWSALFSRAVNAMRPLDTETDGVKLDMAIYSAHGLVFDVDAYELDYLKWKAAEPIYPMEGIGALLEELHARGIRTAVISNLSYSGRALSRRINETLPGNHFEFILASSECFFRKPSPHIFASALGMAGLSAADAWFTGDDAAADIEGAAGAGIFPVWYRSPLKCTYKPASAREPECCHLSVAHWDELRRLISAL